MKRRIDSFQLLNARFLSALVVAMVTLGSAGASSLPQSPADTMPAPPKARPTLVVGIFVEGLNADYVDLLRSNMTNDGFNRLISEGLTLRNVGFGPGIDATAATAMLVTGASPAVNGIPSEQVWDPVTRREHPVLLSPELAGSYTEQQLTPEPLLVSTLADELRISDGGLGQVHVVSADPQTAILLAGHAANSAYWLDTSNGRWTTTRYYRDTPSPISRRNVGITLAHRIDTMAWEPLIALDRYPDLPSYKKLYPFRHTFPARETDRYKHFGQSPLATSELTSIAADYISTLSLGKRGVTDMVALTADVTPWLYGREADNRIETMDAYLRLDRDIARLVQAIDNGPGMANTLLLVAGTPAPSGSKRDEERWHIPSGQFSPRKAISLLNMYLIAIHGNGEWVRGYHNRFFYLNSDLIKERGVDLDLIRRQSAELLAKMSGVSEVYTIDDILSRRAGDDPAALQRNITPGFAGDVLISVNPGWEISDSAEGVEAETASQARQPVVRWQSTSSPVYIIAPSVSRATELVEPVDARAVAPTVARILRIRSPNAASLPPVATH